MEIYPDILYYLICCILSCLVAFAELLSRHNDAKKILKYGSSRIYLIINGLSSVLAYWLLIEMDVLPNNPVLRIIFAGLSSMVILRSSIANIKIDDKEIQGGFAQVIEVFLNSAEESFDRKRSIEDVKDINTIMKNIDFNKAKIVLPVACFSLMKKLSPQKQQSCRDDIIGISSSDDLSNNFKAINLGIILSQVTGIELLQTAINLLGNDIILSDEFDEFDEIFKILEIGEQDD